MCKLPQLEMYELSLMQKMKLSVGCFALNVMILVVSKSIFWHLADSRSPDCTDRCCGTHRIFFWHLWIFVDPFWVSFWQKDMLSDTLDLYIILVPIGVFGNKYQTGYIWYPKAMWTPWPMAQTITSVYDSDVFRRSLEHHISHWTRHNHVLQHAWWCATFHRIAISYLLLVFSCHTSYKVLLPSCQQEIQLRVQLPVTGHSKDGDTPNAGCERCHETGCFSLMRLRTKIYDKRSSNAKSEFKVYPSYETIHCHIVNLKSIGISPTERGPDGNIPPHHYK